ncbi:nitrate reductase cytochrome c-type subunit [Pseudoalteromonas denitrificans]|jgi:cytochrome c-type protein NapB|uniref:Periplasmic nitrate reductase, electron transfer subunit n=1 Tax=Pseudoalteromonas denitrificans DSM 6059 TaxID=1123010 RepID=A0A1I1E8M2_9GAMM|nr:nitrate reductase cytochrome c-type subunit [Pseudoalteromonas denitrificans]SFB81330.1 periplasmic nitrate reductase subunit NapB [Pseudoalteromonas denitrificans DSM 6059]
MKKLITGLVLLGVVATAVAQKDDSSNDALLSNGGIESLRGKAQLSETRESDKMKRVLKDREVVERNYVHQPPVIPHQIRGYKVDLNSNKCLSCHGWKYAKEVGATKVSPTHFETRDGMTLSDISPRRYFCSQCHVPQVDAKPLVKNEFRAVESLSHK